MFGLPIVSFTKSLKHLPIWKISQILLLNYLALHSCSLFRIISFQFLLLFRITNFEFLLLFPITHFEFLVLFRITSFKFLASTRIFSFCLIQGLLNNQFWQKIYPWNQQIKGFDISKNSWLMKKQLKTKKQLIKNICWKCI